MLIRFGVENFRSIADMQELSLVAIDRDSERAVDAPLLGESILLLAAIYGPNASGKSTVLRALAWLQYAVDASLRSWEDEIPTEPFAFGDWQRRRTKFELELLIDGVRHEYIVELDRRGVEYEALFHYPERRRRRVFERTGSVLKIQDGLGRLSGSRKLLTPTTLALSAMRRFDEPITRSFSRVFSQTTVLGLDSVSPHQRFNRTHLSTRQIFEAEQPSQGDLFEGDERTDSVREQALAMLQMADFGVVDVEVTDETAEHADPSGKSFMARRPRTRLVHKGGGVNTSFERDWESNGTNTWFNLIGPLLAALRSGSVVLFDELDRSLHPTLSAELLRLFATPTVNVKGAQLLFTSHDTTLLPHLNRDEVWFTEKNPRLGSTRLGSLSEFAGERERSSANLEQRYLDGRYGALPYVDDSGLLQSLGLIE